jgi:hypothetical protein
MIGFWAGFGLGLLLSIAYDTSRQTSALEGGHRHLNFGGILVIAVVLGGIGAVVASRAASKRLDRVE